jgi:hypothetical protein
LGGGLAAVGANENKSREFVAARVIRMLHKDWEIDFKGHFYIRDFIVTY